MIIALQAIIGLAPETNLIQKGWALQPPVVNKSINLGPQIMKRIVLAQKIQICIVIALLIYFHFDVIRHLRVQIWFVFFYSSLQPLSTKFGKDGFHYYLDHLWTVSLGARVGVFIRSGQIGICSSGRKQTYG